MEIETSQDSIWCEGEDWCPVTATVELIGRKWHPVIIYHLMTGGPMGFNSLKNEIEDVSSKVLTDALDDLEEKALVNREIVSEKPLRVNYELTESGESLREVIDAMADWGRENLTEV